jgi:tellurite resistance protein TerC
MQDVGTLGEWGAFLAVVLALLAVDLGLLHRRERRIGFREALLGSVLWTLVGLAFNAWLWLAHGRGPGLEFLAAYVIERALSFDNIFVFVVIFQYFVVPESLQHRVLYWGILGALASRGLFIALGTALLARFAWLIPVLGVLLVYTGIKILSGKEAEVHPEGNPVVRLFQRFVPLTGRLHGRRFLVREGGRLVATPLALVLVVVEATDVVFAIDSIPAVFGVTRDSFIAFTSNIFAILGLRALYFLLAGMMDRFVYLSYGLGLVLAFVGVKMIVHSYVEIPTALSLGIVLAILAVAVAASLLRPPRASGPPAA